MGSGDLVTGISYSPGVWATGAGLIAKSTLRNWSLQLSVMLKMFWNAGSVKKTDSHSDAETQTCQTWEVFNYYFKRCTCEYASAVMEKWKNSTRLSSAWQAVCRYPSIWCHIMYTYGPLTNTSLLLQRRFHFHHLCDSLFLPCICVSATLHLSWF